MATQASAVQSSTLNKRLTDILHDDHLLAQNRIKALEEDSVWRKSYVDFEKIRERFEKRVGDDSLDLHVNLMQQMIRNDMSITIPNIPDARMIARKNFNPQVPPPERAIMEKLVNESQESFNLAIDDQLAINRFVEHQKRAVTQCHIYGVGYILCDIDDSMDVSKNDELASLVDQFPDLDDFQLKRLEHLSQQISIRSVDVRDVFWEAGVRNVRDPDMRRVTIYEEARTEELRRVYHWVADEIMPNTLTNYGVMTGVDRNRNRQGRVQRSHIIRTWEIELNPTIKRVIDIDGNISEIRYMDRALIYTEIVGGALAIKRIITSDVGSVKLPIIPYYVLESDEHPYGFSKVEMLQDVEDLYVRSLAILYQRALKSLDKDKVFMLRTQLSKDDGAAIRQALGDPDEPLVEIDGNKYPGAGNDISKIIQKWHNVVPQIDQQFQNVLQTALRSFQIQGNMADQDALRSARSGEGKRVQIAAQDRPQTVSLALIARSVGDVKELVWDHFKHIFSQENSVVPGGLAGQIVVNQREKVTIPMTDQFGRPVSLPQAAGPSNPNGEITYDIDVILNDTSIDLRASTDPIGILPPDPIKRAEVLEYYLALGAIVPDTLRDLGLPKDIRDHDDINRQEEAQEQQAQLERAISLQERASQAMLGPAGEPQEELLEGDQQARNAPENVREELGAR